MKPLATKTYKNSLGGKHDQENHFASDIIGNFSPEKSSQTIEYCSISDNSATGGSDNSYLFRSQVTG